MLDSLHPFNVEYITDPSQEELRALALTHTPGIMETSVGNLNKVSRNKARMAKFTYIIDSAENADAYSHQVMERSDAQSLIDAQAAYIADQGKLIEVRGYLGLGPRAVGVQWLYTVEGANIAGMQRVLAFPVSDVLTNGHGFEPKFRVIYTPNHFPQGVPGNQAILVDLENYVTYIMGPDYFGESKKAALRMLNEWTYQNGGLTLHAGAKEVQVDGHTLTMTIMGLSGTGKTTTTFSKQGEVTKPIQDDMVTLWSEGELSITENGCFAKTFGLTEESEPVIYRGTVSDDAWVENVFLEANGNLDFFKTAISADEAKRLRDVLLLTGAPQENLDRFIDGEVQLSDVTDDAGVLLDGWEFVKWTENGRSIIPMSSVDDAADLHNIPSVQQMGILNRDEGADAATPGIVRFSSPEQAAGYFMLGETTKTSAAGKEVGKTRSPFTQPFFPRAHGLQARRFSELAATMPQVALWMMNTGYVSGTAQSVANGQGLKVKIRHSSAMLEAMLTEQVVWTVDPDFGYEIVDVDHPANAELLKKVPVEILNPIRLYQAQGRTDEYAEWVAKMKAGRRSFLEKFGVDQAIIEATCGSLPARTNGTNTVRASV